MTPKVAYNFFLVILRRHIFAEKRDTDKLKQWIVSYVWSPTFFQNLMNFGPQTWFIAHCHGHCQRVVFTWRSPNASQPNFATRSQVARLKNARPEFGSSRSQKLGPKICLLSSGCTTTSRIKREYLRNETSYRQMGKGFSTAKGPYLRSRMRTSRV